MKRICLFVALCVGLACAQTEQAAKTFGGKNPTSRGLFKIYLCADPAAGAEITCTVPTGKVWRVIAMQFTLVTDATVANRNVKLTLDDGTNTFEQAQSQQSGSPYNHAASASVVYSVTPCLPDNGLGAIVKINVICDPILAAGYRIKTTTGSIAGGDNYGAPVVFVEEWSAASGNIGN